jgi:hypothetical protein
VDWKPPLTVIGASLSFGHGCIERATLAEANDRRKDVVFADTVAGLMQQVSQRVRRQVK